MAVLKAVGGHGNLRRVAGGEVEERRVRVWSRVSWVLITTSDLDERGNPEGTRNDPADLGAR